MPADPRSRTGQARGPQGSDLMGVGLQFAASILLFFFLGRWLDGRLGTDPWLMVAGVFVGLAAGFWSIYRKLVVDPGRKTTGKDERKT